MCVITTERTPRPHLHRSTRLANFVINRGSSQRPEQTTDTATEVASRFRRLSLDSTPKSRMETPARNMEIGIHWRGRIYTENTDASAHVAKTACACRRREAGADRLNDAVVSRVRENFHLITREARQVPMQEFFPANSVGKSNMEKKKKKEGVAPTASFWNPSSGVCTAQVRARPEQLPPAGPAII